MSKIPNINWNLPKGELPEKAQETITRYIKTELEKRINKLPEDYIDAAYDLINDDIKHNNYKLIIDVLFNINIEEKGIKD